MVSRMTEEEAEKVHKEKTWLVWEHYSGPRLVRVGRLDNPVRYFVRDKKGVRWSVDGGDLHIATPNDMLKYGE